MLFSPYSVNLWLRLKLFPEHFPWERMGTGREGVSHSAERAADTSRASNDQLLPKPNVTHALKLHLQNATNVSTHRSRMFKS